MNAGMRKVGDSLMQSKMKKAAGFLGLLEALFITGGRTALAVSAEDVVEDATKQTNFLVNWLLSQREAALELLKKLLLVVIVFFIGKWVLKALLKLIDRTMKKREVDLAVQTFVMSFAKIALYMLLIFIIAGMLGVGATIVAILGSAGLAVGLALQGSLSNLAGGVLILLLKPFTIGDYIIVTGVEGTVQKIDIFYTRLLTVDNKLVVIPNGSITGANITNTTKEERRMLQINFWLDFAADLDELKDELYYIMKEDDYLIQDAPMDVVITKFSSAKVQMQLKAWARQEDYWSALARVSEKVKKTIDSKI